MKFFFTAPRFRAPRPAVQVESPSLRRSTDGHPCPRGNRHAPGGGGYPRPAGGAGRAGAESPHYGGGGRPDRSAAPPPRQDPQKRGIGRPPSGAGGHRRLLPESERGGGAGRSRRGRRAGVQRGGRRPQTQAPRRAGRTGADGSLRGRWGKPPGPGRGGAGSRGYPASAGGGERRGRPLRRGARGARPGPGPRGDGGALAEIRRAAGLPRGGAAHPEFRGAAPGGPGSGGKSGLEQIAAGKRRDSLPDRGRGRNGDVRIRRGKRGVHGVTGRLLLVHGCGLRPEPRRGRAARTLFRPQPVRLHHRDEQPGAGTGHRGRRIKGAERGFRDAARGGP